MWCFFCTVIEILEIGSHIHITQPPDLSIWVSFEREMVASFLLLIINVTSLNSWTPVLAGGLISPRVKVYDLTGLQEQISVKRIDHFIWVDAGRPIISPCETEVVTDFFLHIVTCECNGLLEKKKMLGWDLSIDDDFEMCLLLAEMGFKWTKWLGKCTSPERRLIFSPEGPADIWK